MSGLDVGPKVNVAEAALGIHYLQIPAASLKDLQFTRKCLNLTSVSTIYNLSSE
jgi:hypothetical protein